MRLFTFYFSFRSIHSAPFPTPLVKSFRFRFPAPKVKLADCHVPGKHSWTKHISVFKLNLNSTKSYCCRVSHRRILPIRSLPSQFRTYTGPCLFRGEGKVILNLMMLRTTML